MKWFVILLLIWPAMAVAQSSTVLPHELKLQVTIEEADNTPLTREMVLLTIRGTYRRHITRESLVQPDFDGFNWSQLGPDTWLEERLDGKKVKTFVRRMAIYPDRAGELTIGAFRHRLTLTDEGDDWFDHEVVSEPITLQVEPAPPTSDWWFPVRQLRISDQWSNAPDQLKPGEGVLRVIRIEAAGVTPEMIPPMPELRSPSAMIFAHPEKRLVELTPSGPLTIAFWRWTIRPGNDVSTIVEPLTVDYFDTTTREQRTVTISPQRVAYDAALQSAPPASDTEGDERGQGALPGALSVMASALMFAVCVIIGLRGRVWSGIPRLPEWLAQRRALKRAARAGRVQELRRALVTLSHTDPHAEKYRDRLAGLDAAIFSGETVDDLRKFAP